MQNLIEKCRNLCDQKRQIIVSATGLVKGGPDPNLCVINTIALLNEIDDFFGTGKARFLPTNITGETRRHLEQIINNLQDINGHGVGQSQLIEHTLTEMEELYAHCLKYGLITFGLDAKEKTRLIQDIRNKAHEIGSLLDKIHSDIEGLDMEKRDAITRQSEAAITRIKEIVSSFEGDIEKCRLELVNLDVQSRQSISNQIKQTQRGIEAGAERFKSDIEDIKQNLDNLDFEKREHITRKADESLEEMSQITRSFAVDAENLHKKLESLEQTGSEELREKLTAIREGMEKLYEVLKARSVELHSTLDKLQDECAAESNRHKMLVQEKTDETLKDIKEKTNTILQDIGEKTDNTLQKVDDTTNAALQQVDEKASSAIQELDETANAVLQKMADKTNTTLQQVDDKTSASLQEVEETTSTTLQEISEQIKALQDEFRKQLVDLETLKREKENDLSKLAAVSREEISNISSHFREEMQQIRNEINQIVEHQHQFFRETETTGNELLEKIKNTQANTLILEREIRGTLESSKLSQQDIVKLQQSINALQLQFEQQLELVKQSLQQAQNYSEDALDMAAQVQAKDETAQKLILEMEQIKGDIDSFYKDIDKHREQIELIRENAASNFKSFGDSAAEKIEEFLRQTESITSENSVLKERMEQLLEQTGQTLNHSRENQQEIETILHKVQNSREEIQQIHQAIKDITSQSEQQVQVIQDVLQESREQVRYFLEKAEQIQEKQEEADQSVTHIESLKDQIISFFGNIERYREELVQLRQGADEQLGEMAQKWQAAVARQNDNTRELIQGNEELQLQVSNLLNELLQTQANMRQLEEDLQLNLEQARGKHADIAQLKEEVVSIKSDCERQLQDAQSALQQMDEQAEKSVEIIFQIQQRNENAQQSLTQIEQIQQRANDIYQNIEQHKTQVEEAIRHDLDEISVTYTRQLQDYEQHINEIKERNQVLQQEMEELLRNAEQTRTHGREIEQDLQAIQERASSQQHDTKRIREEVGELQLNVLQQAQQIAQRLESVQLLAQESQQITADMQNRQESAFQALQEIADYRQEIHEFYINIERYREEIIKAKAAMEDNFDSLTQSTNARLKYFDKRTTGIVERNTELQEQIDELIHSVKTAQSQTIQVEQELKNTLDAARLAHQDISHTQRLVGNISTDFSQQLQAAKQALQKTHNQIDMTNKLVAELKSKQDISNKMIDNMEEIQGRINAFHLSIDRYKNEMEETRRNSLQRISEMQDLQEKNLAGYEQRTNAIIAENERLQKDIRELLSHALGSNLGEAFHKRQEYLAAGRQFWKWALGVVSLFFVIAMGAIVLTGQTEFGAGFFFELVIATTIAAVMVFCMIQYRKERQAEEEYAYKAAISLGLEPYRDMFDKLREGTTLEADFVMKLMQDTFDNPVKRIYQTVGLSNGQKKLEELPRKISEAIKSIPENALTTNRIIDTIQSIFSRMEKQKKN